MSHPRLTEEKAAGHVPQTPAEARGRQWGANGRPPPRGWTAAVLAVGLWFSSTGCQHRPDDHLVEIERAVPGVVLDLRYATTNNFTGQVLYPEARAWLRPRTAARLAAVARDLAPLGLRLKVFDAYRPWSAQQQLWARVPDERYVAHPAKGSRHNRGAAVDVTLVRADGTELPMPTAFDDFSERAHRDYSDLPAEVLANRDLLDRAMSRRGFVGLPTEWWHFDDRDYRRYKLLDVPLSGPAPGAPAGRR
jgi:D-alanyl-D-alanine dipeptidase